MKYSLKLTLLLFSIVFIAAKCRKKSNNNTQPKTEQLPPATQEGKNTCGFLVNGKVWLPKGNDGRPNLDGWYDPGYANGTFNIHGYRYDSNEGTSFTYFGIGISNCSQPGLYVLNKTSERVAQYGDYNKNCTYYPSDTIPMTNSYINVTKLDLINGIVSGTFQYTLAKPGCDTIRITQGRFDFKL